MTTTTSKRRGEGANYQFLPQQIREGRSISPKEKKILGYIISKCVLSSVYDNEGCIAISYDQLKKGAKVRSAGTIQYSIRSLVMGGYLTYKPGTHLNEANRYTLSPMLTDMINKKTKMINYIPADDKTDIDMALPEQQPAPVEDIDYKEKYNSLVARFQKWITDLSGMDSGKDGGKYIEEAVAYYRNRKDSNEQPVEKLQEENKQLKAEVEKLRKCLDASLQEETPQEQHDAELQKYKNSLDAATSEIKAKNARIGELENRLNNRDSERDKAFDSMYKRAIDAEQHIKELKEEVEQQKLVHEEKIEKLTESIRSKDGAIKILQNDLKKAKTGESILVTEEPSTLYGGTVKKIQYN